MCLVSLGRTGQIGGLRPPGEMAPTKKILRTAYGSPASACRKRIRIQRHHGWPLANYLSGKDRQLVRCEMRSIRTGKIRSLPLPVCQLFTGPVLQGVRPDSAPAKRRGKAI